MTVSNHLYQLLIHHDCVIVPNFGGFLIQDSSAKLSDKKELIYPPASEITFNVNLRDNDKLLLNHIMTTENISSKAASDKIEAFVDQATQQLIDTKSFVINGIGKLIINENDLIQFQPNKIANFNTNSFGLPAVKATRINHTLLQQKQVKVFIDEKRKQPLAIIFTVAACFMALVLAGSLYFWHNGTPQEKDLVKQSFSIFSSSETIPTSAEIEEKVVPIVDNKEELKESVAEFKKELEGNNPSVSTNNRELELKRDETTTLQPIKSKADFHVVIGMFEVEENALKIDAKAKSKGYSPTIIKGRKYYRVVVPYFKSDSNWKDAVSNLKQDVSPGAWIWETRNK